MEEIKKYKGLNGISNILIAIISLIVVTIAIYTNAGYLISESEKIKIAYPNAIIVVMLADFIPVGLMLLPFVLWFGMVAKSVFWNK